MAAQKPADSEVVRAWREPTQQYREREATARATRHERAAADVTALLRSAGDSSHGDAPLGLQAVKLLCVALQADGATVTLIRGDQGRLCRISRGTSPEQYPSRRWPLAATQAAGLAEHPPAPIEIEHLMSPSARALVPQQPAAGTTSAFHALLYAPGSSLPFGCLSLHSRRDLQLDVARRAFLDVLTGELAAILAASPLPDTSETTSR